MLASPCIGSANAITPATAAREPVGQQPASPERTSAPLDAASQLQAEADRHIEARQFETATDETERALAIRRQSLGEMHPDVAYSLNRLGSIAYYRGQYDRAEALIGEALRIREATLGPEHPDVADSLNDLAALVQVRGDYVRPEPMYRRALAICDKSLADSRTAPVSVNLQALRAAVLSNLGRLYYLRGDYRRAEAQYLAALAIEEGTHGSDDPGVAQTLASVGGVYYSSGQYGKAAQVLQRALGIQETRLPADHPSLAASSFNLAAVYFSQGNYAKAESLFQRALSIDEQNLDPQHPRLATRLIGLAEALRREGDYARAEPLYERALAIRQRALGPGHPDVAATLIARSLLQYATGDVAGATDLMSRGADLRDETLAFVLTTGSEAQKQLYLRTLRDETDIAVSLHLGSAPSSPAAARLAFTSILQRKGRSIDATADQNASVRRHLDDTERGLLEQLSRARSRLARAALTGVATDEQRQSMTALRSDVQQLQDDIETRSAEFRIASRTATLQDLQKALPDGTALIEFFLYRPFLVANAYASAYGPPHYAAYVLRREGIAGSVDLGAEAVIDQQIRRFGVALSNPMDQSVRRAGRTLYNR